MYEWKRRIEKMTDDRQRAREEKRHRKTYPIKVSNRIILQQMSTALKFLPEF